MARFRIAIFKVTQGKKAEDIAELAKILPTPYDKTVSFAFGPNGELKTREGKKNITVLVTKIFSLKCKWCDKEFNLTSYELEASAVNWNAFFPLDAESAWNAFVDIPDHVQELCKKIKDHYQLEHPNQWLALEPKP